jgi:hypothetical protein
MDKRYQVFVSSTYADLKEERQKVIQTIMEMDCIPSGMELFPAMDEEQWLFIKRIIDDCDYYILIIGGRYGSVASDGISYTEKEYDYAIEKGIKVIAFIHEDPDSLVVSRTDKDPELNRKLLSFIEKVRTNRLIKYWKNTEEIPGLVSLSLTKTIKTYPAIGWVRANTIGSTELLSEINSLRKENNIMREKVEALTTIEDSKNDLSLASIDDDFVIHGSVQISFNGTWNNWEVKTSWKNIFSIIAPYLLEHPNDSSVKTLVRRNYTTQKYQTYNDSKLDDQDYQTIKLQLSAYKLVNIKYTKAVNGSMMLFWNLTEAGTQYMYELRTIKKSG